MSEAMKRIALFLVIVFLLIVGKHLHVQGYIYEKGADSDYYVQYAKHVASHGLAGFRDIVDWYAQSQENRSHPSPARIAYITSVAFFFNVFGPSYSVLVYISYASLLIFLGVCFYYARKLFSEDFAVCFLIVLSSSTLTLGMGSVALSDSMVNLSWGCSVWAFMDFIAQPSRRKAAVLIAFLTLSLLLKESSVLLIGFVVLFSMGVARFLKVKIKTKDVFWICVWPLAITGMIYWTVLGGWGRLYLLGKAIYSTHFIDQVNLYASQFSGGPWFRYFIDFMMLSPVITLMAIGYMGYLILKRSRDWKQMFFLVYFMFIYFCLSCLQHTKVVRFVINLEMVMALFCVSAILEFFKSQIRQDRWGLALVVLIVVSAVSFNSYMGLFASTSLLDPVTYHLAVLQGFIPSMK